MKKRNSEIVRGNMRYRYLGNSGLKVSIIGFGNYFNSNSESSYEKTRDSIKLCYESGINFFDSAEIYSNGEAERQMGRAFKELGLKRENLVISTKLFKLGDDVNATFMSRKHIVDGLTDSLKRL
jgi:aryl-alcohol dehydrogenase-like predicted oxidoreductase